MPQVPTGECVAKVSAPDEASNHTGACWYPPCAELRTGPGSLSAGSGGDSYPFKAMGPSVGAGGSQAQTVLFQGRTRRKELGCSGRAGAWSRN